MRLCEAKIKDAILHPEKLVRHEALHYFAVSFSRDPEVMPLAIKAIETFGRGGAFSYLHMLTYLAQSQSTVDWVIRELHRKEQGTEDRDVLFPTLSRLLCHADLHLVIPRELEIIDAPGFDEDLLPDLRERGQLLAWDADKCWRELETAAARGASDGEVDWSHVGLVVEALARNGDSHVDRILELLGHKVEDFENNPMIWMEIFLVMLAGEMRLEAAVPFLVQKLITLGEVLSEEAVDALGKIGTDAAAEAVTERWLASEWDYRLYASSALEKIHSDTSVRKCLELMPQEKDTGIRTNLAYALLGQFAEEAIEPVRELVQRRTYDPTVCDLPARLVAASTILGVTFPEYAILKDQAEDRRATQERKTKEMRTIFQAPPASTQPEEWMDTSAGKLTPLLRTQKHVGRNDPCPCGSGKKFKKCCLKRSHE
jgi:SEC-C motif